MSQPERGRHRLTPALAVVVALTLVGAVAPAGVGATGSERGGQATTIAFPGARGFGAHAVGGRGGDVAIVTTLADDGPGSLRSAVTDTTGPRTVVFAVGGTIDLDRPLRIDGTHLTIAGQTAPGGITVRGYPVEIVDAAHIVVRHLRFRPGDINAAGVPDKPPRGNGDLGGSAADALTVIGSEHVIIDHVSASWSMDETLSVTKSADVTVQHSLIGESLDDSYHPEGNHGYGSLVRGTGERGYTFWRNLWAHHERRSPAFGGQQDPPPPGEPGQGLDLDLVNNVMYDWGLLPTHTLSEPYQLRVNLEANTYIRGPSSLLPLALFNIEATADELAVHRSGNLFDNDADGAFDPLPLVDSDTFGEITWVADRFDFDRRQPQVLRAERAYRRVLQEVGASIHRDAVDERIVDQVRTQTGAIIDSQDEVGGWDTDPVTEQAPPDRDADGMADRWERRRGLDPDDASDRNGHDLHRRFSNLEIYLARLAR